jgi:hypothetical protein
MSKSGSRRKLTAYESKEKYRLSENEIMEDTLSENASKK